MASRQASPQRCNGRLEVAAQGAFIGDHVGAETLFLESLTENYRDVQARLGLVKLYRKQGRADEAREALHVLVSKHEDWGTSISHDPKYLITYAELCDETFRPEEAETMYRRILEIGKKSPGSRFPQVVTEGLSRSEARAAALLIAGFQHSKVGESDQSLSLYRKATERSPNYSLAHFYYAYELLKSGQFIHSKAEFEHARELEPTNELLIAESDRCLKEIEYTLDGLKRMRDGVLSHPNLPD